VERKRFLLNLRDVGSPSGFSIVPGISLLKIILFSTDMEFFLFPFKIPGGHQLCYRSLKAVLGVSHRLIASVAGTPKARAPPVAGLKARLGNVTNLMKYWENLPFHSYFQHKKGFNCEDTLPNKSDSVEAWLPGLINIMLLCSSIAT
jgi:hypothetical protein